jgi:Holliday junction resolvase-like predicted endonuclease
VSSGDLGRQAEDRAAGFLEGLGYGILERRWRCPMGELDIVAMDGETLVFVEVKALSYLKAKALRPAGLRFDVVGFGPGMEAEHIPNAFEAGGYTF